MRLKILILLLIGVFLFYPILFVTKIANGTFSLIKQDGCFTNVSKSINESKSENFLVAEYQSDKKNIVLKDSTIKNIPKSWVENNWCHSYDWLLNRTKSKGKGYKFLVEFKFDDNEFPAFFLKNAKNGRGHYTGGNLKAHNIALESITDTIIVYVEQKKTDSWKETIVVDTIIFRKKTTANTVYN